METRSRTTSTYLWRSKKKNHWLERCGLEQSTLKPRVRHYTVEIWKRLFHTENASLNVFRSQYAGKIWKRNNHRSLWICFWGKLGQANHIIIVVSSFSPGSVYKMRVFRPHQNAKCAFSNSFGLKSVFEKLRFRDGLVWTVGLTVEKKLCFQIPPVWRAFPKSSIFVTV